MANPAPGEPPSLSAREKISLAGKILVIFPASLASFIVRNLFVYDRWFFRVKNAGSRCLTGSMTVSQLQYFFPPTAVSYTKWARSKGFPPNIENLPAAHSGEAAARIMWLGEPWKPGNKLLLYFHGGGYVLPMMPGHMDFLHYVKKVAGQSELRDTLSIAILEYTNTPIQKYPFQLGQATQALSRLLARGVPPSAIIVGGDSAGGHLTLALTSHILHPHPSVPPLSISEPLAALALISPATLISSASSPAFEKYSNIDILSSPMCKYWTSQLTEGSTFAEDLAAGNYWGEATPAPENWWRGIGKVTRKMLVTAGEEEVLVDDIRVFIRKMENVQKIEGDNFQLESVVAKGEVHDAPLMDFIINFKKSETTRKVAEFVVAAFGKDQGAIMSRL